MFYLTLPPLKERKAEILLMAQFFLEKIAHHLRRPVRRFADEAQRMILDYSWPGNIRELRNTIERAVILCDGDTIELKHFACEMMQQEKTFQSFQPTIADLKNASLREYLAEIEKSLLIQALQMSGGNQLQAAKLLGEERHIVRYLLKKHGLEEDKISMTRISNIK